MGTKAAASHILLEGAETYGIAAISEDPSIVSLLCQIAFTS